MFAVVSVVRGLIVYRAWLIDCMSKKRKIVLDPTVEDVDAFMQRFTTLRGFDGRTGPMGRIFEDENARMDDLDDHDSQLYRSTDRTECVGKSHPVQYG